QLQWRSIGRNDPHPAVVKATSERGKPLLRHSKSDKPHGGRPDDAETTIGTAEQNGFTGGVIFDGTPCVLLEGRSRYPRFRPPAATVPGNERNTCRSAATRAING